ncbi:hypothetical protein ACLMJK_002487 [Lecanora helva]
MHFSHLPLFLIPLASAHPFLYQRADNGTFAGVCTFNDYVDQVTNRNQPTVCGDYTDDGNIFAAAAGDLSPDISRGQCTYTPDEQAENRNVCTEPDSTGPNQQPNSGTYHGPACPHAACNSCYKVTNNDSGKSVTVKIVDACPAKSAYNYCKSNTEPAGKCGGSKNALDISVHAYPLLVNGGEGKGQTVRVLSTSFPPDKKLTKVSQGSTTNLNNLSITPMASCTPS